MDTAFRDDVVWDRVFIELSKHDDLLLEGICPPFSLQGMLTDLLRVDPWLSSDAELDELLRYKELDSNLS